MAETAYEPLADTPTECERLRAMIAALEQERDSKVVAVDMSRADRIIITTSSALADRELAQTVAGLMKVFWVTAWALEDRRAATRLARAEALLDCAMDELPTDSELAEGIKEWMEA